eukprot:13520136-Alexandrium_andersonii.AAC.1
MPQVRFQVGLVGRRRPSTGALLVAAQGAQTGLLVLHAALPRALSALPVRGIEHQGVPAPLGRTLRRERLAQRPRRRWGDRCHSQPAPARVVVGPRQGCSS